MTRSIKARFGQVGDQVSQVKDQVGQGQGQELDNNDCCIFVCVIKFHDHNTTVSAIYHVFKIKNIKICVIFDSMNIVSIFLVCIKNICQFKILKCFSSEIDFSIL